MADLKAGSFADYEVVQIQLPNFIMDAAKKLDTFRCQFFDSLLLELQKVRCSWCAGVGHGYEINHIFSGTKTVQILPDLENSLLMAESDMLQKDQ